LNNANLDSLQKLLEGNYDDLLVGVDLDPNFLSDTQKEKDRVNFNKLKMYYTACMDETAINHLGPTPIFPSIARMFTTLGYSPESFSDQRFSPQHVRVLTNALIELNMQGVENLVSIGVGVDDRHPDQYTIFINQPGLTLPSREYYSQPGIMEKYRQGLVSVVTSILGDMNGDENANLRLQKMTENKLNALGSVDIEAMVDRFVEFETQLASMTLPM
jgi:endothelin-converting enzyme